MSVFYLIRHGETYANKLNIMQGTLNSEITKLTIRGQREASKYKNLLQEYEIDKVFTSPLARAIATSQIICQSNNMPFSIDSRLSEISYGNWNGQKIKTLKTKYTEHFDQATNDLKSTSSAISQGESFKHARLRIADFISSVSKKYPNDRILVVTHGWVIKTFVSLCLPQGSQIILNVPHNLSLTKIGVGEANLARIYYYNRQLE